MSNRCFNTILISGPREDVSILYKSLKEYKAEIMSKEKETETGINPYNIGTWIKAKFSDKLPKFTEEDYKLSYSNFILKHTYSEDSHVADLNIYTESKWDSRMYALVKLIEVGFPKCIINYISTGPGMDYFINTDESGYYFQEKWYYHNRFKSDYYMSNEYMYRTLINDYADIIKDNNIVIPELIYQGKDQICKLVESLVEYDEDLYVYPFSIGPEYDDKKVEILKCITGKAAE